METEQGSSNSIQYLITVVIIKPCTNLNLINNCYAVIRNDTYLLTSYNSYVFWLCEEGDAVECLLALSLLCWVIVPDVSWLLFSSEYLLLLWRLYMAAEWGWWGSTLPLCRVGVEWVEEYGDGGIDSIPGRSLLYWHQRLPSFRITVLILKLILRVVNV